MKTQVLLRPNGVHELLSLAESLPVDIRIGTRTPSGNEEVTFEYEERDQLCVEWLISRAEEA